MKLIQITFKEAQSLGFQDVTITLTEDGINYFRPLKKIYVVRHWWNESDYGEVEFDDLKQAKKFALANYKEFEILEYNDVSFRYWTKQQVYKDGELTEEYEQ